MRRTLLILAVGGLAIVLLALGGGAFLFERPVKLTVAVSSQDQDDYALMTAAAARLKHEHKTLRLKLVPVEGAAAASKAAEDGQVDLAVVRTDLAMPSNAQTVVILHRDAAILVAPASSELKEVADLPDHTIGVIRDGLANTHLIDALLGQYDVRPDRVKIVALTLGEVGEAIKAKRIDAVMAVEVASSPQLHAMVKAVMTAGDGPPKFIAVEEADAIAQRTPLYDKLEIVKGAFGGSPPRPNDEFDTLSVTHRLVARETLDETPVAALTRFFLSERSALALTVPIARSIEAPSTDKGSALPVHAGAAAYIDDEEETFFDKYSDMIYMGAMFFGVLASGATAMLSRISARRTATIGTSIDRLVEMLGEVRVAASASALDGLQGEADAILAETLGGAPGGEDGRLQAFGLALDQLRAAIADRRQVLSGAGGLIVANAGRYGGAAAAE